MKKARFIKHTNYTMQKLKNYYSQNWFCLWFFCIITIIGFIFGVISVNKYSDSITTSNLLDLKFMEYLKKECSSFSLTLSYFLKFLFFEILFLCLCCNRILSLLCFVVMAYFGFSMGINCTIIVIVFKISGILHVCLCYFPFFLIEVILLSIIYCTFLMRLSCSCRLANRHYLEFDKEFLKQVIFFAMVGFIIFFLQSLINSLTTSTIIVII